MLEKIIELTADTLGANAAEITAETSFMDDLHADSLDLFELAMALEEEFSVDWVRCVCQTPDMTEQEREGFLEEFQDRLMFGTDMVNTDMVFPLGEWLDRQYQEGKLSAQAYRKICFENAKKIFQL